jgi:hypothetical protein
MAFTHHKYHILTSYYCVNFAIMETSMIRIFLLLVLVVIIISSCGMSLPATTTTTVPATVPTTTQTITTPTAQQPTVTVVNELVVTMRAMNMEQTICVGAQIGKERVPQIVQSGALPNATEVAIITQCVTASMPLINGMYTPTPGNHSINTP